MSNLISIGRSRNLKGGASSDFESRTLPICYAGVSIGTPGGTMFVWLATSGNDDGSAITLSCLLGKLGC